MVKKPTYRINQSIRTPKVRVVDDKGEQLGILDTSKALKLAQEKGLDLVEVAPSAKPPVVRILDYKKWLFERGKKEGKKEKKTELKELRFRPNIGEHDLKTRAQRASGFLRDGDKVKLTVIFRGRERAHPEVGLEKLKYLIDYLKEAGRPEKEPERSTAGYEVTLVPIRRK
ncbi:translation initiation factor IF-3 [Candidatus Saccharibacteria bacterium]|nr:translation initiation factor IF-3 [Candidatus Saccharibacteria bacterium]